MAESNEEKALKAGWKQHPLVGRSADASRWSKPALTLRVWAVHNLIQTAAYVEWMGDDGKLVHHQIVSATWRPTEVTEALVVEWGHRALGKWLSEQMEGAGE